MDRKSTTDKSDKQKSSNQLMKSYTIISDKNHLHLHNENKKDDKTHDKKLKVTNKLGSDKMLNKIDDKTTKKILESDSKIISVEKSDEAIKLEQEKLISSLEKEVASLKKVCISFIINLIPNLQFNRNY